MKSRLKCYKLKKVVRVGIREKTGRSIKLGLYFKATGKYMAESKASDDLRCYGLPGKPLVFIGPLKT